MSLIGKTFHSTVADASVKFEVVKRAAPGIYRCVSRDPEYGCERLMDEVSLKAILKSEQITQEAQRRVDAYIASLNVGDIVHYHHVFNIFVQCEVVEGTPKSFNTWEQYGISLKPIALLGKVKEYDLPKIINGRVHIPHLSKMVLNGELFTPHPSNIYEYQPDNKVNPTELEMVSIEIPKLTEADERMTQINNAFCKVLDLEPSEENLNKAIEILQAIK